MAPGFVPSSFPYDFGLAVLAAVLLWVVQKSLRFVLGVSQRYWFFFPPFPPDFVRTDELTESMRLEIRWMRAPRFVALLSAAVVLILMALIPALHFAAPSLLNETPIAGTLVLGPLFLLIPFSIGYYLWLTAYDAFCQEAREIGIDPPSR